MTFGDIFYITYSVFVLIVLVIRLFNNKFLELKKERKFTVKLRNRRVVFINVYLIFCLIILGVVICMPVLEAPISLIYRVITLLLLFIWTLAYVNIRIESIKSR